MGLVGGVGDAHPAVGGGEEADFEGAALDEAGEGGGEVELGG